jgi:hypothetical protein
VLADLERIVVGVRAGVEAIREAYPSRDLTLMSALAEGADRIVAEEVLRLSGSRLEAVLPFAVDEYLRDFGAPGSPSRVHFLALLDRASSTHVMPEAPTREEGYQRSGIYIVEHADVLLAVWDASSRQGRGGTGDVVEHARSVRKPIVIVLAGNRRTGTQEPTSLGPRQGEILLERLPAPG